MRTVAPLVVALLVALQPGSAWGAGKLGLSKDGTHWAPNLTTPLFDPSFRWVPGDREESWFFVRNQSGDKATLDIVLSGSSVDALLETGDLRVDVRAGDGPWKGTTLTGRRPLVTSMPVAPGQRLKVSVAVALDSSATNQSQVKALDLRFGVRLTQASAAHRDHDERDDHERTDRDREGFLPGMGGPAWWLLPAGVLSFATGWFTVAAVRRREVSDV